MTSKSKKDLRTRETHIYLTEKDYAELAKLAVQESRSVNGQILHLVRQGLAEARGV